MILCLLGLNDLNPDNSPLQVSSGMGGVTDLFYSLFNESFAIRMKSSQGFASFRGQSDFPLDHSGKTSS
jgi:hypothetical protein